MAKEMMIIFVYDTQLLQKEDDDPASAILYFHPSWVSDQQRTALCGQIIGTCHFLSTTFHCPRIFALQSGKFSIRMYGRYLLAIGTDRNVADWVLEHRANTLTSLISFFHHDLEKLSEFYPEPTNLSAKLYHMFETYLKILMYGGHIFFNTPTLQLPKSASYVFLEAMQLLQSSQQMNHVLGGAILYHNKVVATQLSMDLTRQLILTDPYRIKSPAELITIDFALPLGVQLLKVYITDRDYRNLLQDASQYRSIPQNLKSTAARKTSTSKPILSAMKRDQSLIFTTVPEEDGEQHSPVNIRQVKPSPDRPKSLNLRTKTTEPLPPLPVRPTPSGGVPINLGQTSVCSTPMTELNKVLHQNIMSICVDPDKEEQRPRNDNKDSKKGSLQVPNNNFENSRLFSINTCTFDKKKSSSMWEVREKLKSFNKRITMRYYSIGLLNLNDDLEVDLKALPRKIAYKTIADPLCPFFKTDGSVVSGSLYERYTREPLNFLDLEQPPVKAKNSSNTNTEEWKSLEDFDSDAWPSGAVRKPEPFSKEVRKSLTLPLKSLTEQQTSENIFSPSNRGRNHGGVQLTPLMSKLSLLAMEEKSSSGFCSRDATPSEYKDFKFAPAPSMAGNRRKSVITEEISDERKLHGSALFVCGQQDMVMALLLDEQIRNSPDVISKLFELCTESLGRLERQLRHCLETYPGNSAQSDTGEPYSYLCMDTQWDSVQRGGPWGGVELGVLTHLHRDFMNTSSLTEIILRAKELLVPLLIAVPYSIIVILIWSLGAIILPFTLKAEICLDIINLNGYEVPILVTWVVALILYTYVFIHILSLWHTYESIEDERPLEDKMKTLYAYRRFGISFVNDDSIIYGYQCGKTEVFYQQSVASAAGLPTPADHMGTVPLKARRRLERDHAIILL